MEPDGTLRAADLAEVAHRAASAAPDLRRRAVAEVLDAVACMRLGSSHPLVVSAAAAGRHWQEPGHHSSFAGGGLGLEEAVRLDALACHVDELDSIAPSAAVVPAAVVVPAALHVGHRVGAGGPAVVDAVLAGFDVVTLAGRALGGPASYGRGWWPTSTVGALGAAAATGVLLGLDREQLGHALGLAAARTGGLLSDDVLGAGHYLAAADATVAGLRAGLLAGSGLEASDTYLAGPARRAFTGWRSVALPQPGAGVAESVVKPYPCARPLQGVVTALLSSGLPLDQLDLLDRVVVELPGPLLRFVSVDVEVPDATRAAASVAHVLAAARAGRAGDPRFFRAASLVGQPPLPQLELRPWDGAPDDSWSCRLLLRGADGTEHESIGEPPVLDVTEVPAKAAATLAAAGVPPGASDAVVADLTHLECCPDLRELDLHRRLAEEAHD